ncbi:MAG: hypothetical protein Q8N83_07590 [Ignavibacteria bacterium]|nr:hypothetical protein [Ignavibacteria bacterium]
MKQLILLVYMLLTIIGCEDNPTDAKKSENHSPTIFSLIVFPDIVGPQDSAIVICNAFDPDGDTLVYDWITDARLRIKGANPPSDSRLFNTFEDSRIFYPTQRAIDTVWVQCFARDRKGKSDAKLVLFIVRKDSL